MLVGIETNKRKVVLKMIVTFRSSSSRARSGTGSGFCSSSRADTVNGPSYHSRCGTSFGSRTLSGSCSGFPFGRKTRSVIGACSWKWSLGVELKNMEKGLL